MILKKGARRLAFFIFLLFVVSSFQSRAEAQGGDIRLQQIVVQLESLKKQLAEYDAKRKEYEEKILELQQEIERLKLQMPEERPPTPQVVAEPPPSIFNPQITVFANALWRLDDKKVFLEEDGKRERIDDKFNLREVEIDFRAAIDPFADGVLTLGVESEIPGEFEVGVEEGYALIKRLPFMEKPPLGLLLKAGRFRTEFGRFNRLHTHDLPQSTRPLALESFLGPEGHVATGASARLLLPTPFDRESALEFIVQAFQGGDIAVAEEGKNNAGFLGNLRWFRTFADNHHLDLSAITHFASSDESGKLPVFTYSLDFLYKWKPLRRGEWRSFLLGGQLFFSDRKFEETLLLDGEGGLSILRRASNTPLGYFIFAQRQFNRRLHAGLRWDFSEDINDDSIQRRAIQPYLTYYFSEFFRMRFSWEHRWSDIEAEDKRDTLFTELNYLFGSHPLEPFWVTK